MDVLSGGVELQLVLRRRSVVAAVGHVGGGAGRAQLLRLLDRLLAPTAGEYVVGARAVAQEVLRHHRELQTRSAL